MTRRKIDMINDYESEARARWGNTDAYHPKSAGEG